MLGLFRAYSEAGGTIQAGSSASLGRGLLRIRSRRLGGRAAGGTVSSRLYRVSQGDDVDVHCAQYFVHSSLSPVLLFRRRLKSVADVLEGIRSKGFAQSRWDALLRLLGMLYVVMVRVVLFPHFIPEYVWIPPDLHGFYRWVFDSLEVLNGFLKQVVGILGFVSGLGGFGKIWVPGVMLGSGLILFLLLPFLVVKDPQTLSSRILVEPHLIDAEFRKSLDAFFCRSGHPVLTPVSSWTLLALASGASSGSSSDHGSGFAGGGSC